MDTFLITRLLTGNITQLTPMSNPTSLDKADFKIILHRDWNRLSAMKTPMIVIQKRAPDGWIDISEPLFKGEAKRRKISLAFKDRFSCYRLFDLKTLSPLGE